MPPPIPHATASVAPPPPAAPQPSVAPPSPAAPLASEVRDDPSPVLSQAAPPQVYQSWPTDDEPVDFATIGVRRSLLARLPSLSRFRISLPGDRAEWTRRARTAAVAALRLFRKVLDRVAELTVELELRLRG